MTTYRRARKDANHAPIVRALRQVGATVIDTSAIGQAGCPDLVIGFRGLVHLIEVKNPASRYGKAGASEVQRDWAATWNGPVPHVVTSVDEALAAIGAIAPQNGAR
jgi:Holliday junction resolvase-like predicted endonuclease